MIVVKSKAHNLTENITRAWIKNCVPYQYVEKENKN